jgi:hypothetical protein
MPRTIAEVIANLPPNDGRLQWWEDMAARIKSKQYRYVLMRLSQHNVDCDFKQQVEIIAREIVANADK